METQGATHFRFFNIFNNTLNPVQQAIGVHHNRKGSPKATRNKPEEETPLQTRGFLPERKAQTLLFVTCNKRGLTRRPLVAYCVRQQQTSHKREATDGR
jgi:hypothetical protein